MTDVILKERLMADGATLVGFCKTDVSPIKELPDLLYCISIAYKLSDAVLKTVTDRPSISYFQHYRAVNAKLDQLALYCTRLIEENGYEAFPIAASQSLPGKENALYGVFQHKTAARLAGLGYIGKNAMLITKDYGSKVRFATVLTNMPLTVGTPIDDDCGNCEVCLHACPAGAISGKNYVVGMDRAEFFDAEKCSLNMKTYNDVGRGAVCGLCMVACPKNKLK